ncbi:BRO-N domain-containing protein [Solidesulfovibrio carbinolicus]|uniref:Bro-N domain-containing protein n=1 Tax=Solidesulfovibrio carbinolicus TaxID=296842 RepID=A0A4V0YQR8_9BACT|nr:BRO family protein [Solidesulfovibrio carbinolicus]QAZ67252.1 hypothetical protein C3Y92_08420 [Solidesulfovibrio carbinolicus]
MAKRSATPVIEGELVPIGESFAGPIADNILLNSDDDQIRVVVDGAGRPWFVARDVCAAFGDTHYRRSFGRLDDDEKGVTHIVTAGGKQLMAIVNEQGLFSMLLSMDPKKSPLCHVDYERVNRRIDKLKAFKRWLFKEVLPAIRKYGAYMTPTVVEKALIDIDTIIDLALKLKAERSTGDSACKDASFAITS